MHEGEAREGGAALAGGGARVGCGEGELEDVEQEFAREGQEWREGRGARGRGGERADRRGTPGRRRRRRGLTHGSGGRAARVFVKVGCDARGDARCARWGGSGTRRWGRRRTRRRGGGLRAALALGDVGCRVKQVEKFVAGEAAGERGHGWERARRGRATARRERERELASADRPARSRPPSPDQTSRSDSESRGSRNELPSLDSPALSACMAHEAHRPCRMAALLSSTAAPRVCSSPSTSPSSGPSPRLSALAELLTSASSLLVSTLSRSPPFTRADFARPRQVSAATPHAGSPHSRDPPIPRAPSTLSCPLRSLCSPARATPSSLFKLAVDSNTASTVHLSLPSRAAQWAQSRTWVIGQQVGPSDRGWSLRSVSASAQLHVRSFVQSSLLLPRSPLPCPLFSSSSRLCPLSRPPPPFDPAFVPHRPARPYQPVPCP